MSTWPTPYIFSNKLNNNKMMFKKWALESYLVIKSELELSPDFYVEHSYITLPVTSVEYYWIAAFFNCILFKNSLPRHGKTIKFLGDKQLLRNNLFSYSCQGLKKIAEKFLKFNAHKKSFLYSLRRKKYIHIHTYTHLFWII